MSRLFICGQAPSRVGDGRAFSGPSGKRLAALFNLRDYEHLASQVTLINIFDQPAERLEARGDHFDRVAAAEVGTALMEKFHEYPNDVYVIACGHAVYEALTGIKKMEFFHGRDFAGVEVWCFPHPSGASSYWNTRSHVLLAANFLRKLLKRAGIMMTR